MEHRYYTPERLEAEIAEFERRFELSSERFIDAYRRDKVPAEIPRFDAFTWATAIGELRRMRTRAHQLVG